jgi:integrase
VINRLMHNTLASAKPRKTKYKLYDGDGLVLLVKPTGGKYWQFKYRFEGRDKWLSLGTFPEITLDKARDLRVENRKKVAEGSDPGAVRKANKAERMKAAYTYGEMLSSFIKRQRDTNAWKTTTLEQRQYWADKLILPEFGQQSAQHLATDDGAKQQMRDFFTKIYNSRKDGKADTAKRVRNLMSQAFEHGLALGGKVTRNPINELRGKYLIPSKKIQHHAAIIVPSRIGELLRSIDFYGGRPVTRLALKLCSYLFLRSSELRNTLWSEVMLDGSEPELRIPMDRMKMEKGYHLIPLARQTVAMFRELHKLTGHSKFVFPNDVHRDRVMSETTISSALKAMGFLNDEMTHHGFRGTASTRLNELDFAPDIIELQLAHQERDDVRGAYNQAQKIPQRRAMMQAWADQLDNYRDKIYDSRERRWDLLEFPAAMNDSLFASDSLAT